MPNNTISLDWTPFALSCLDEIHDYIVFKEKSTESADKLINRIFDSVDQLVDFPESGQEEPLLKDIGHNGRYLVEASYKIIYEFHSIHKMVVVIDVFHTSQYPVKLQRSSK